MNSLNILSSRVGQASIPARSRRRSLLSLSASQDAPEERALHDAPARTTEKTPLLLREEDQGPLATTKPWLLAARHFFDTFAEMIQFLLSALAAPGVYAVQWFRENMGPARRLRQSWPEASFLQQQQQQEEEYERQEQEVTMGEWDKEEEEEAGGEEEEEGGGGGGGGRGNRGGRTMKNKSTDDTTGSGRQLRGYPSRDSILSTTSESDNDRRIGKDASSSRSSARNRGPVVEDDNSAPRRSIRIKLHHEEMLKRRKEKRLLATTHADSEAAAAKAGPGARTSSSNTSRTAATTLNPNALKSPTSPSAAHKRTKYPHSPAPPRPLIPPRLPSYAASSRTAHVPQKTLVLDLDETLIHSLAKGGRMSSGHMVEVKLSMTTALGPGGLTPAATTPSLGPQHPILYYVHKRPHCDDFLRKVYKWYKLVVFTASVQEYADPVIDWLEQERKFFHARYYRQHCTLRNGAYIKDLSSVEPNLSQVMILDNSPISYSFHQDNAIPIEGWINDPTDNDLLHLIPMLEALQYVTDVRAFLALRRGEVET